MQALILEHAGKLAIRDINIEQTLGRDDVKIAMRNVGVCGSDVHYYKHGAIGPFVVREPMVLGHEASGIVTAVGDNVTHLQPGDRVCMEPGIPDLKSRATLEGKYNLDPAVSFWATPPIHGCLITSVSQKAHSSSRWLQACRPPTRPASGRVMLPWSSGPAPLACSLPSPRWPAVAAA
jgi:D-xylulose reductase